MLRRVFHKVILILGCAALLIVATGGNPKKNSNESSFTFNQNNMKSKWSRLDNYFKQNSFKIQKPKGG